MIKVMSREITRFVQSTIVDSASINATVYGVSRAVEETTKTKYVSGVIGQAVAVSDWKVAVIGVKETRYLRSGDSYFAAREGEKAVVVILRIRNTGGCFSLHIYL